MTVLHGDCLELCNAFPDASFDSVITDPPYELGFMGKSWDATGIAYNTATWLNVLRVLKPGGHMLAFGGSRTYHRIACAIEDAGFELRDCIMWIYGSGFPKSHNLEGDWDGWGTALKPAFEPIIVARKPLIGTVASNVLQFGTGAINIEASRVPAEHATGWGGGAAGGNTWNETNTGLAKDGDARPVDGRWPANVIHDGSDEVIAGFPETKSGIGAVKRASAADADGNTSAALGKESRPDGTEIFCFGDQGSAARFFYCAKASKADRDEGLDGFGLNVADMQHRRPRSELDDPRRAGTVPRKNHHPTVKPVSLMRYLVRLVTPPNGCVLDPFAGSGSTGKACVLEGFNFIGFEKEAEYVPIANARIDAARKARVA